MIRSGFKPRVPLPRTATPEGKPPKLKSCKVCRQKFSPRMPLQVACGWECAQVHGQKVTAQQKAKQQRLERAQDKAKLEGMKTYPQLIAACQRAFNAMIRERDKDKPCICCGRTSTKVDVLRGHGWDCGHWRSTGSAPHLRFHPDNAHRQLVYCNRNGAGRALDYRRGLVERIGIERVEALESNNTPANWSHDDLRQMTKEFQRQLREMKKGNV